MSYLPQLTSAIKRITLVLMLVCLFGIGSLAASNELPATTGTVLDNPDVPNPPPQRPAASPTPDKQAQGRQYGQPGFVGEPINLNVVNADIRDILNYITEQYGVNFVIDTSVGAVPVTVNVQDVPWNVALDAILRANRLGIEVNGNILRVASRDVLAAEASTQRVINDSRLDASPLVTEFIRLNYARASGTLAQAAGSTGAFSGGATNLSFSGGAGGDATGGSGDQGTLKKTLKQFGNSSLSWTSLSRKLKLKPALSSRSETSVATSARNCQQVSSILAAVVLVISLRCLPPLLQGVVPAAVLAQVPVRERAVQSRSASSEVWLELLRPILPSQPPPQIQSLV